MFRQLLNDADLQKKLNLNPQEAIKIFYQIPPRNTCSRFWFGFTRLLNGIEADIGTLHLCDTISENITLGMIPESTDCKKIIDHVASKNLDPLGTVISPVDYFELSGNTLFLKPIASTPDWKKHGIEHFILPMKDRTADVPVECLILAIDKMRECVSKKKSIFVHCKAGKSRSPTPIAIYLALFDKDCIDDNVEKALDNAEKKIKSARKKCELGVAKRLKAIETIQAIREIQKTKPLEEPEQKSDNNTLNKLLASPLIKFEISQLDSFKELARYAAYHDAMLVGVTKRTEHIKNLFEQIYSSTNANWLANYKKLTDPLVNADPWFVWDSGPNNSFGLGCVEADEEKRKSLVNGFFTEIISFLSTKLHCEKISLLKALKETKKTGFSGGFFQKINNEVVTIKAITEISHPTPST